MGGTARVSRDLVWMPANWIFNNVLEAMAADLENEHHDLAEMLLHARMWEGTGLLDITSASPTALRLIERSIDSRIKALNDSGPHSFAMPEYFDVFLSECLDFQKMLRERMECES